jgi:cytochrome P450
MDRRDRGRRLGRKGFTFAAKKKDQPDDGLTDPVARYNAAVARLDKAVYSLIAERRHTRAVQEGLANAGDVGAGDIGAGDSDTGDWGSGTVTRPGTVTGGGGRGPDLLDRLLDATDDGEGGDGGGMDDRSLRDELMTLMVAGQETSAILLSWWGRRSGVWGLRVCSACPPLRV